MGQAKQKLQKFIKDHPFCCFCGGSVPTHNREHAPPKVLFLKGERLDGLIFPACERCNNGMSENDVYASIIALTQAYDMLTSGPRFKDYDRKIGKLIEEQKSRLKKNQLEFLNNDPVWVRTNGILQKFPTVRLPSTAYSEYLEPWFAKQAIALWYEHTGKVFSQQGAIGLHHYMAHERAKVRQIIGSMPFNPSSVPITINQGSRNNADQFQYRVQLDDQRNIGVICVEIHRGLSFVALVSDLPNHNFEQNVRHIASRHAWRVSTQHGIYRTSSLRT